VGLYIAGKKIDPVKTEFTVKVKAVYHDFQTQRSVYAGDCLPPDKRYLSALLEQNRGDITKLLEKMAATSDIESGVKINNEIDWKFTSWEQAVLNCNQVFSTDWGRKNHPLLGGKQEAKIKVKPLSLISAPRSTNLNPSLSVSLYPSKPVSLYPSKSPAHSHKSISTDTKEMEIKNLSLALHYKDDFDNAVADFIAHVFNGVLRAPELKSGEYGDELKQGLQEILQNGQTSILKAESVEKSSESKSAQKQPRSAPKFALVGDVCRFLEKFIESKMSFIKTPELWAGQSGTFRKQCRLTAEELFVQAKNNYAYMEKSEEHHLV
jgi:hypothetical protein